MSYTKIFYWITVADNARDFFWFFGVICAIVMIISFVAALSVDSKEERTVARSWLFWSTPISFLMWFGIIFTPTQKQALFIIAGGSIADYLTADSTAKQLPKDALMFVQSELRLMYQEAKLDIDITKTKQNIIDEAKNMDPASLIEKMRQDTSFKENLKLVRLVNRLNRRGEHVSDEIIKQFISLANQYKPEEKTEKAPLSEIIQIFA